MKRSSVTCEHWTLKYFCDLKKYYWKLLVEQFNIIASTQPGDPRPSDQLLKYF